MYGQKKSYLLRRLVNVLIIIFVLFLTVNNKSYAATWKSNSFKLVYNIEEEQSLSLRFAPPDNLSSYFTNIIPVDNYTEPQKIAYLIATFNVDNILEYVKMYWSGTMVNEDNSAYLLDYNMDVYFPDDTQLSESTELFNGTMMNSVSMSNIELNDTGGLQNIQELCYFEAAYDELSLNSAFIGHYNDTLYLEFRSQ